MPLLYIFAMWFSQREYLIKENVILVNKVQKQRRPLMATFEHSFYQVNACITGWLGLKENSLYLNKYIYVCERQASVYNIKGVIAFCAKPHKTKTANI